MPRTALIGHTGFVGGNLRDQAHFDELYRSTDIGELAGRSYDLIVCSGAPAEKWKINQAPEADRANLAKLRDALSASRAETMILISTVDVFGRPVGVDEGTPVATDGLHPYGLHRFELELFVREHFPRTLVVRLPGLFGPGLKKNVIYDFLHDNNVDRIHSEAAFQFYDVRRLWADIGVADRAGLDLIHLATEPVTVSEVVRHALGRNFHQEPPGVAPARYDFRTRHAGLYGETGPYMRSKADVLTDLRDFVATERAGGA